MVTVLKCYPTSMFIKIVLKPDISPNKNRTNTVPRLEHTVRTIFTICFIHFIHMIMTIIICK